MSLHRWSGWPGAFCLRCFCEDPVELALADGAHEDVIDPETLALAYPGHPGLASCWVADAQTDDYIPLAIKPSEKKV